VSIGSIFWRLARSFGDLVGVTAEGRRLPTSNFFVGVRVSSRIALSRVKPEGGSLVNINGGSESIYRLGTA